MATMILDSCDISAEELTQIARQVRGEMVVFFELAGPQAKYMTGCCGEAAFRVAKILRGMGVMPVCLSVQINQEMGHTVVLAGRYLIDATVTQFLAPELARFAPRPLRKDQFVFTLPEMVMAEPWRAQEDNEDALWLGDYPVGPMTQIMEHKPTQAEIDAGRGYMIRSFETRFSHDMAEFSGKAALQRAAQSADPIWRRAVAMILPEMPQQDAAYLAGVLTAGR